MFLNTTQHRVVLVEKLIDVHAHLEDELFDKDLEQVVIRAKKAGVQAIVTSPIVLEDVEKAENIVEKYKGYVFLSIGLDPAITDLEVFEEQARRVKEKIGEIVALGEVGLDYYYVRGDERRVQRRIFKEWIKIARDYKLPLIVHSRSAGKYAVKMLLEEEYYDVIMHAYDGSVGWALEAVKKGVKFSIPPSVWFSIQKQKLVKKLPLESIVLESDSPVLSPIRGERNEPANLTYTVKKIAELKGVGEDRVVEETLRSTLEVLPRISIEHSKHCRS